MGENHWVPKISQHDWVGLIIWTCNYLGIAIISTSRHFWNRSSRQSHKQIFSLSYWLVWLDQRSQTNRLDGFFSIPSYVTLKKFYDIVSSKHPPLSDLKFGINGFKMFFLVLAMIRRSLKSWQLKLSSFWQDFLLPSLELHLREICTVKTSHT